LILIIGDGKATYTQILSGSSSKVISLNATALKPPGQSMNAEQNKDDRRHLSAKRSRRINATTPLKFEQPTAESPPF